MHKSKMFKHSISVGDFQDRQKGIGSTKNNGSKQIQCEDDEGFKIYINQKERSRSKTREAKESDA
jgi:hypothetical protein